MKIKSVLTYDSSCKRLRLFRCLWQYGIVGDGEGFSVALSCALTPQMFCLERAWSSIAVSLFGIRLHYQRSYGGILT
jgi:hypothetical protein